MLFKGFLCIPTSLERAKHDIEYVRETYFPSCTQEQCYLHVV